MNFKLLAMVAVLSLLGARASAQQNLLPQGTFDNPGVNTGWAEGFQIPNNQEFRVVTEGGKHWLRLENHDATRQLDYVHAFVKVTPQIASLTVSVRMKATDLKPGTVGWHDARVALSFEGGSFGYPPKVPELRSDSPGVTQSVELPVPKGATRLNIQPAMFYCTGVFEITDLTVTPNLTAPTTPGDAAPPAALDWDKENIETVNAMRSQVSLDGDWRFNPTVEGATGPPETGWAYIKVPGDWQDHQGKPSSFVARGTGPEWDLYDGSSVSRAWYERQVPIPAEWQGRFISLRFDRVCTDAIVYVNGVDCGRVLWPWGSVDITKAVTPGKTADVRVLVAAIADAGQVGSFWQNALANVTYSSARLATRGLTGSVFLESRSSEAHVTNVFVRTSTRKKEISLDVELTGVTQAGLASFTADMLDEKGAVEKTFTASAPVDATETQTVTLSWPWANPRLWDVGQPNLYTLRLKVMGAGLDDLFNQEFGFREFWVEGRKFFLNGTEIRLRQGCFYYGPRPQVGENYWEMGSNTVDTRGDDSDAGAELDDADRKGYLAGVYILNANRFVMGPGGKITWSQNRPRAMERAEVWMRHYRNHPSAVIWIAGFNFFGSPVDEDPRHLGRHGWDKSNQRWQSILAAGKDMFEGLKKLDPTRVYYSHAGAYTGDIYTINCYLDMLPLQEREDWLSDWAKTGEMPISMVEFGTPVDCSFRRGHDGFTSNITSEPLLTEYAAIYFGTDAYSSEEPKYRQFLHDLFRSGMLYNTSENKLDEYADMHKIQQLYRTNTWRSWRTAGLTGGMRTWSWIQDKLKEDNGPTLAWIAGQPGAYTSKDHHFWSGQKFEKQIVLINDTRQPQKFTATWSTKVGGREVAGGKLNGRLAIAEIRKMPIQVTAPRETTSAKIDGQITLTAAIGQARHHDTFEFRVFGADRPSKGSIAIIDPGGMTTKMLDSLGYTTHPWNGGPAPLVVIGRNALKTEPVLAARLEPYVRSGGRALICEQDPVWMAKALGWRLCPDVSRRVFPMNSAVSRGLDADDLRDWNGASTLIAAYPKYVGAFLRGNEGNQPYAGWHWGNRGGVTSAAIEKPHLSGWRPLLECEFDLAYTPLMELDFGKGRLIVSTLDLEDHAAVDPAARRMAAQVFDYALHSPLAPRVSKVVYVGGDAGAAWLDKIGVSFERSKTLARDAGLLLVGSDAAIDEAALRSYVRAGGRVFFLPRSTAEGPLGVTLQPAPAQFAGSISVPSWPEARGLSASDLRWRSYLDNPPWILRPGPETGADGLIGREVLGKGVAIFCQIDPGRFHADQKTYFRYTRWRSTRAVAQLLANLGATFRVDGRVFHPLDTTIVNLDGAWQMKVTDQLPAASSDTTAYSDPGITLLAKQLVRKTAPAAGWTTVTLPQMLPFFDKYDGEAVFRKEVDIPPNESGKDMTLALGVLDDFDNTFFNGVEVGHTGKETANWWQTPRYYVVPGKLVKAGRNVIAVRIFDRFNAGGFAGGVDSSSGDQSGHQATGVGAGPMSLMPRPTDAQTLQYYYPDYRTDFPMGDNPYRYYRW
ncbi:MAG TPA: beta-galactosidase [Armatimonadota bacterium]|nr:beta-galactosidase [Armatimonadota bacterium]